MADHHSHPADEPAPQRWAAPLLAMATLCAASAGLTAVVLGHDPPRPRINEAPAFLPETIDRAPEEPRPSSGATEPRIMAPTEPPDEAVPPSSEAEVPPSSEPPTPWSAAPATSSSTPEETAGAPPEAEESPAPAAADAPEPASEEPTAPALSSKPWLEPFYSESVSCGVNTGNVGEYCCNPSCGICARVGQGCDRARRCGNEIAFPESQTCGMATCNVGLVCCNPSCGICAPPGAGCSERVCVY